jgi:hypothetical protein
VSLAAAACVAACAAGLSGFFFAADFWNFSVSGFNVLSLAVLKQHVDVVRLLIAAGADVNAAI